MVGFYVFFFFGWFFGCELIFRGCFKRTASGHPGGPREKEIHDSREGCFEVK